MKSFSNTFKKSKLFIVIIFASFYAIYAQGVNAEHMQEWQTINSHSKHELGVIQSSAFLDSCGLDSFIIKTMEENKIPGVSSCIINDGQIVWEGYYGFANIEQNMEVTESTSFLLASVSKTITATAIMQLWEDGLFGLDDDINNYLPPELQVINPMRPNHKITFRQLLTHTSSMNYDESFIESLISWGSDSPIALDSFLVDYFMPDGSYYSNRSFAQNLPGERRRYSNIAVALLGYLVEVIADIPFAEYCRENIFIPLGMDETSWFLSEMDTNNLAMPYWYDNGSFTPYGHYGNPAYPCGWLKSSASDLVRYLMTYINGGEVDGIRILESATIDSMSTAQFSSYQGLIWIVGKYHNTILCEHGGGTFGCRTYILYSPNKEFGVIALSNMDSGHMEGVFNPIIDELNNYAFLYDKIYAENVKISSTFMNPTIDTLLITTQFVNPKSHSFSANAIIRNLDNTEVDSIALFDDGNHGDLQADDGVWGNYILPIPTENEFIVDISTKNLSTEEYFVLLNMARFTTIGPVTVEDYVILSADSVPNPGDQVDLQLELKNYGSTVSATEIRARIISLDSLATVTRDIEAYYNNIDPGVSATSRSRFGIKIADTSPPNIEIPFKVDISSNNRSFWSDTISISITETSVAAKKDIILEFDLYQNYPNPFNPKTVIKYQLPIVSDVELSIYSITGQKVATLVSELQLAGNYKYDWDAGALASGVYYYRLATDDFVQIKKLILLK
jgi:CubicO group peptidase (beta-lactamase class C family)